MMFGSNNEPDPSEEAEKNRAHQMHARNIGQPKDGSDAAEILRYLAEIDDLPIDPESDPMLGQLVNKVTSTANFSPEEVKSEQWVMEYLLILYLSKYPTSRGMHTHERAIAHDDMSAYRKPIDAEKRAEIEAFLSSGRKALSRSEDFKAVEESVRTVSESVLRDESKEEESKGGLRGLLSY